MKFPAFALSLSLTLASLALTGTALAQSKYIKEANTKYFYRDDVPLAVVSEVSGGQRAIELPPRDIDKPFLTPLRLAFYPSGSDALLSQVVADFSPDARPGTSTLVGFAGRESRRRDYTESLFTRLEFPRLEQGSPQTGPFVCESVGGDQTPIIRGSALGGPGNQKKWLPANFRLRLGDLPTASARVIQPFAVSVAVADLDGDGSPERVVQASPITFEVSPGDAAAFRDAFQKSVDGEPVYQNLELEVFNGDASVIALRAEVAVSGIGPVDPLAEPGEGPVAVTVKGSGPIKKGHVTLIK